MQVKIFSLFAVFIAAAVAVGGSGAVTAKERGVAKIDVSTTSGVIHYLRSIHVSTRKVVIQRGLRNYAGAHCPGKGWTCARTRHTVVQIAKRGGLNRFACRTAKCAVVQFGGASRGLRRFAASRAPKPPPPPNTALCVKTTGITQSCVINQPNASGLNKAVVWMVTPKLTGLTQSATYTASITQGPASATGSSNNNLACVTQFVWIDGSTTKTNAASTTVTNDNHESISINQNSLTGSNTIQGAVSPTTGGNGVYDCNPDATAPLTQDEQLTSVVTSKGSITQNQDTATTGSANVVVDIEQNQNDVGGFKGNASGLNNARFEQSTNQVAIANTPNGTVTQQQGANVPNPPFSGLVGTINQDSKARSTASATQTETQCQDAVNMTLPAPPPGAPPTCPVDGDTGVPAGVTLTQTQYGPEGVFTPPAKSAGRVPFAHKGYGASTQTGAAAGVVDSFTLIQLSTQRNDGPGAHTTTTQSNIIQGDCQSDGGSCTAGQQATLNDQDTFDGYTAGTITGLIIHCTNGHSTCHATPPPKPEITGTPDDPSESRSATFTWTDDATAGVTFECKLDDGSFDMCSSGGTGATFSGLALGSHTFEVRAVDTTPDKNASDSDSFTWTIIPFVTFDATPDSSAGWSGTPGLSPINLTVGSDAGTYAQVNLNNFEGIAIGDLEEPTFTTDTYSPGSPRYEIDFSDGNYVFGYPSQAGFGTTSWELIDCSSGCVSQGFMSWSDVQNAEGSATVAAALIEADGSQSPGTDLITDFTFDGYSLSFFTN